MSLDLLESVLKAHLADGPALATWFAGAMKSAAGTRLAICLAIDLHLGEIHPALVDELVASFATSSDSLTAHFASLTTLKANTTPLRKVKAETESLNVDYYARTMKLASFVTRYLPDRGVTLDYVDLEEIRKTYFPDDLASIGSRGGSMKEVTDYWSGRYGLVWVTPFEELVNTASSNDACMGCAINDALGLGFQSEGDSVPFLVTIRYPFGHKMPCARPNVFHADWTAEGYFLSAGFPTDWGLTHSCTGSSACQRERVHNGFAGLNDEFRGYSIGPVGPWTPDVPKLLADGLARLGELLQQKEKGSEHRTA